MSPRVIDRMIRVYDGVLKAAREGKECPSSFHCYVERACPADRVRISSRAYSEEMTRFEEGANGQEASFHAGELFEVFLSETRTTGFKWVVERGGEPVCALAGESTDAPPGPPGRAGTHLWQFRAAQAGFATIRLVYRRPWESSAEPGRVFQMQIRVTE